MTDTDVTLLPNYDYMDLARLHVMILTSLRPCPVPDFRQGWACD